MKNWRTFAAGVAGAAFEACYPIITTGTFDLHRDWPYLVKAAGIAVFGYLAKDAMVTGTPKDPKMGVGGAGMSMHEFMEQNRKDNE